MLDSGTPGSPSNPSLLTSNTYTPGKKRGDFLIQAQFPAHRALIIHIRTGHSKALRLSLGEEK